MHLQPLYAHAPVVGGAIANDLFARGLCIPSGSNLTEIDRERVAAVVRRTSTRGGSRHAIAGDRT